MAETDPLPPFSPRATYQGIPCVSWQASRTVGLESDSYQVVVPANAVEGLQWKPTPGGLYAPAKGGGAPQSTAANEDGATAKPLSGEIAVRGDLVMSDGRGPGVTLEGLYVRDDGVETVDPGDDPDAVGPTVMTRIHLVDIRYWWARRGELWGTYNVLRPDGTYAPGTVVGDPTGGLGLTGGETSIRGETARPYSLAEILALIFDRLPGRPQLVKAPDLTKIAPLNLRWRGKLPKAELERLLSTYGLVLALTTKNEVILTDAAEAAPQRGKSGDARRLGGADLPLGAWWRDLRATHRHRPEAVRVVGPAVIREVRVSNLEHVGYKRGVVDREDEPEDPSIPVGQSVERDFDGQITPPVERGALVAAGEAAKSYGLTLADIAAMTTQSPRVRERFCRERGAGESAASEIHQWAFRLFRFPRAAMGFLPILQERATTYVPRGAEQTGERASVPPLVEADIFVESILTVNELRAAREQAAGGPGASGGAGGGGGATADPRNADTLGTDEQAPSELDADGLFDDVPDGANQFPDQGQFFRDAVTARERATARARAIDAATSGASPAGVAAAYFGVGGPGYTSSTSPPPPIPAGHAARPAGSFNPGAGGRR